MGNTASSKDRHQDSVDYGSLHPQGIYTGPQDWNHNVVAQLIIERKLAPFYTPLEDYEDDWDEDQILAARKLRTRATGSDGEPAHIPPAPTPPRSHSHSSKSSRAGKEPQRLTEAQIYKSAVECPICFLVPYPLRHSLAILKAKNYHFAMPSIIHQTSITLVAASRLYAPSVSSKSNAPSQPQPISYLNLPVVRIAYRRTLA